jgi:hypothetical protein
MERTEILDLMGELKLYGMRGGYDEIMAAPSSASTNRRASSATCSRPRSPRSRRARSSTSSPSPSCRWPRISIEFDFEGTPINESAGARSRWRRLPRPAAQRRPGRRHGHRQDPPGDRDRPACIRGGARGRFFNVVDLVNKLEAETRAGRQGRWPITWPVGLRRAR